MTGDSLIWIDGSQASELPLPDRGLDFGDGVFETLLLKESEPLHEPLHLARLQRGCDALFFPSCVASTQKHLATAAAHIKSLDWPFASVRITLTRGPGPRGYAPPVDPRPRCIITTTRLDNDVLRMLPPARLGLATIRWPLQRALVGLKHLNRLEQVLAAREFRQQGLDEAVMLDQEGSVISVTAGNLYAVINADIVTPRLDCCGIHGTRRDLLINRWAPAAGRAVIESRLGVEQLEQADELFYSNSLVGLRPVASFGKARWSRHNTCAVLYQHYLGDVG